MNSIINIQQKDISDIKYENNKKINLIVSQCLSKK